MESFRIKPLAMALAFGLSTFCAAGVSAADMMHKSKGVAHDGMHMKMSARMHADHKRMHMARHDRHASVARMAAAAVRPMRMARAASKPAGSCGTFMYWKAGACVDARVTPVKK